MSNFSFCYNVWSIIILLYIKILSPCQVVFFYIPKNVDYPLFVCISPQISCIMSIMCMWYALINGERDRMVISYMCHSPRGLWTLLHMYNRSIAPCLRCRYLDNIAHPVSRNTHLKIHRLLKVQFLRKYSKMRYYCFLIHSYYIMCKFLCVKSNWPRTRNNHLVHCTCNKNASFVNICIITVALCVPINYWSDAVVRIIFWFKFN